MKVLSLVLILVFCILAGPLAAEAQQAGKVPRIGILLSSPPGGSADALRDGLRQLGHVEGQNIAIEWKSAGERPERFSDLAAELVRSKSTSQDDRQTSATP